jgi:hypothetical protein
MNCPFVFLLPLYLLHALSSNCCYTVNARSLTKHIRICTYNIHILHPCPFTRWYQNVPDWCRHLYSSYGSTKKLSQQAKLWIPGSTVTFCGDCVKTCEDVSPICSDNRPGFFTKTVPSTLSIFWRKFKTAVIPHPPYSPDLAPCVTSSYLQKWNHWAYPGRIAESAWHWQKTTSRKRSKNGGDGGTGAYTREGTTSRVMAADRPYGEFYDFTASVRNILDTPLYNLNQQIPYFNSLRTCRNISFPIQFTAPFPCCPQFSSSEYLITKMSPFTILT